LLLLDDKHCGFIITRGGISDVLDSEYKEKIEGGEKSKIKKGITEPDYHNYGYYGLFFPLQ
jgi:hypothetical protein